MVAWAEATAVVVMVAGLAEEAREGAMAEGGLAVAMVVEVTEEVRAVAAREAAREAAV